MTGATGGRFDEHLPSMQLSEEGRRRLQRLEDVVRQRCAPVLQRAAQVAASLRASPDSTDKASAASANIMNWRGRYLDD